MSNTAIQKITHLPYIGSREFNAVGVASFDFGGSVKTYVAGGNLNVGDVVYFSSANTVNKSTTTSLYGTVAGVVVGGKATYYNVVTSWVAGSQPSAASTGELVLVQINGIAFVAAEGAISAGSNVGPSSSVAGRVASSAATATLLNNLRNYMLYQPLGNPDFARVSNFDVQNNNAISYVNNGILRTLANSQLFDTGTSKTITGSKWGAAILSVTSGGSPNLLWATGAGYDTEADALNALVHPGGTNTVLGAVTVQAHASGFTAGTDALAGGTGGNPATTTNYLNRINPNNLMIVQTFLPNLGVALQTVSTAGAKTAIIINI